MTPTGLAGFFSAAVEGVLDAAVLRRILVDLNLGLDRVFGQQGKGFLRERIAGFNHDARFRPWIVLVDLDHDAKCPSALVTDWLPQPAPAAEINSDSLRRCRKHLRELRRKLL
jgi:hypothetical protein